MATVVPRLVCRVKLVCLVDRVDGLLYIPKTENIVSILHFYLAMALTDSRTHCFRCLQILPGSQSGWSRTGSTRWNRWVNRIGDSHNGGYPAGLVFTLACITTTYTEIPRPVIVPARCRVHQPGWIDLLDARSQLIFRVSLDQLTPALVVYYLKGVRTRRLSTARSNSPRS